MQALRHPVWPARQRHALHRIRPVPAEPEDLQRLHPRSPEAPGGAEIELTLLCADVRGWTQLAERAGAEEFSKLMARFYGAAATAVDRLDGIVDKFVGDEVVALFIPGFAGPNHGSDAIAAARELLQSTGHDDEPWVPVGAGCTRESPS